MNLAAVYHRRTPSMCYSTDGHDVVINIMTRKDVDAVYLVHEDPFVQVLVGEPWWFGVRKKMKPSRELANHMIYSVHVQAKHRRLMYYFEIEADGETYCYMENKFCKKSELDEMFSHQFKFSWIHADEIFTPPAWVGDSVWCQIRPDRFARHHDAPPQADNLRSWDDTLPDERYGGTLKGITEHLDYLQELGITGVYMMPIFQSASHHKYDTDDYFKIDRDFGTEEDLRELIAEAHKRGIHVMLDIVFNHCGLGFEPWKDVLEKGRKSKYFDWFYINDENGLHKDDPFTEDDRFYSFGFEASMPKFNTSNPEVIQFCCDISAYWIKTCDIDGIRFDVGDELSNKFLRTVREKTKELKPDLFLLGENWQDSLQWLQGDEYDSMMNYPFWSTVYDYWHNKNLTARDFAYTMNICHTRYPDPVNRVLLNILDTHDTVARFEAGVGEDALLQKILVALTMTGVPCFYYGTEIAMRESPELLDRVTMPWDDIEAGKYDDFRKKVTDLIAMRYAHKELRENEVTYQFDEVHPRLVSYIKGDKIKVILNAGDDAVSVADQGEILFANRYQNGTLEAGGSLVILLA